MDRQIKARRNSGILGTPYLIQSTICKLHEASGPAKTGKPASSQLPCNFRLFCGGSDETRTRDLRYVWKTKAMRSGLHPLIADAIVGHGDRKKDVKSVHLTISDADLLREIDRLTFDHGKTEIWGQK